MKLYKPRKQFLELRNKMIITLVNSGQYSGAEIAQIFNISRQQISNIIKDKNNE